MKQNCSVLVEASRTEIKRTTQRSKIRGVMGSDLDVCHNIDRGFGDESKIESEVPRVNK
jgi:hypothetical protein